MVNINLMPWRELELAYQKKIIKIGCFVSIMLMLVLIGLPHLIMSYRVGVLQERVDELKASLTELEAVKKNQDEKKEVEGEGEGQKTSVSLGEVFALFVSLNKYEDNGVCFLSMARRKKAVIFSGLTYSVSDLSSFLSHWKAANHFSQIKIEQLQPKGNHRIQFRMRAIGSERNRI